MFEKIRSDKINICEGLITVFAIILAVEYATEGYDLWDIFIGVIVIYLGVYGYWDKAKQENEFLYYVLTTNLLSLGILNIFNCIIYFIFGKEIFLLNNNISFIIFILTSFTLYKKLTKQESV